MKLFACLLTAASLTWSLGVHAQDANLRKTLTERIPQLEKIDEIRPTPMSGLFEVRIGTDLFYTDAKGNYLIQGELIDTKARRNLTEDRMNQLTAVDFKQLPLKDAVTIVHGKGERKMAVFEDPNCGYCKRFERDLQNVDNVTIYLFLYPILSPDSAEKSRNIWCAKDQAGAWADHMLRDKVPAAAQCDTSAVQRNLAFGRKYKITGTPTVIFTNNTRVPGAISAQEVEKNLAAAAAALSYGVMNLLMAATPLAMQVCGYQFSDAAWVLEWHVIGMFAPGFFTGHLIKKFGTLQIMAVGVLPGDCPRGGKRNQYLAVVVGVVWAHGCGTVYHLQVPYAGAAARAR